MSFQIIRQDITKMDVDAVVNAANTELKMGGGVCGAIFRAAGEKELQKACNQLAPIRTGEAVITPGFHLKAKYIIHTAGPVYTSYEPEQSQKLLQSAYMNSLLLAAENECRSIAFPLISSGIYGYPKEDAFNVANRTIRTFLHDRDMDIYLAIFDKDSVQISSDLQREIAVFIDEHYFDLSIAGQKNLPGAKQIDADNAVLYEAKVTHRLFPETAKAALPSSLDSRLGGLDEPFAALLLRLIDKRGKTDVEIYKRANLDRKLFSKIRTNKDYLPSKRTAVALALALELDRKETDLFLARAGYALSPSQKFDVIIEYFILHRKYDIFEINEVLFAYDQPLLGS
jgi:O-acetyl-ADP-ribose deacetylase (regulator of RNase III)